MNRRSFLKSIATACGAAVVCPGELLKSPVDELYLTYLRIKQRGWPKFRNFTEYKRRRAWLLAKPKFKLNFDYQYETNQT